MFYLRALEQDTNTTTPGLRKYYAANKFSRLYKPELIENLFVILDLWKVVNKGEEIEDEGWSKNTKIRQSLDTLSSYPNEFWKYPVVVYYISYRNEESFEEKFELFLNKLLMELMTKYILAPTINAVKQDILKLDSKIIYSDTPSFDFKEIDTSRLEAEIKAPNRNVVRMLLKTLAYEEQDDLLPSRWEIEHIGNKLPFEKKLNIVAGNGYFGKKKALYKASKIAITKKMGDSNVDNWSLDSITERDLRITDIIVETLKRWNDEYIAQSSGNQKEMPTEEQLAQIEEFKKKGWIKQVI